MNFTRWVAVSIAILCPLGAAGQSAPANDMQTSGAAASGYRPRSQSESPQHLVITGLPYSARKAILRTERLSDGSVKTIRVESMEWRDAQGRTRTEQLSLNGDNTHVVNIFDPVARRRLSWNAGPNLVHEVMETPVEGEFTTVHQLPGTDLSEQQRRVELEWHADPNMTGESLGTANINGVQAKGIRTTTILPGTKDENGQPLKRVHEQWRSTDELRLIVRSKFEDPRMGSGETELTDIRRDNPDASLFRPPEGWKVQVVKIQ